MAIKSVDYNPFASQYGPSDSFTSPTVNKQPLAPRAPDPRQEMLQEPIVESDVHAMRSRMESDPGVRTARGMIRKGEQDGQDRIFQDLRARFSDNPQALSMLKYLEAQQAYGQRTSEALASVARPRADARYPVASQPVPQIMPQQMPQQQPGGQIPQQPQYRSMRPQPGMVVNGYRLVNPAKPNDRASWQPVTEK